MPNLEIGIGETMLVKVQMLAFENEGVVRLVNVPDNELCADPLHALETVFYYGQNDFQPQNICSLSCGDVAEYEGKNYLCCFAGWQEIDDETLASYKAIPRRNRGLVAMLATMDEIKTEIKKSEAKEP